MKKIRLGLTQFTIELGERDRNLRRIDQLLETVSEPFDLLVLPEVFSSGFGARATQVAETMEGAAVEWMARRARQLDIHIAGSLVIREGEHLFNRLVWMGPGGLIGCYDKRHLFSYAGEHRRFSSGRQQLTVELCGWRIRPLVCYDLRFPVWCRNQDDYDLLLFVANWPRPRSDAWDRLLPARAIENQAGVVAVNCSGETFPGHSAAFDWAGNCLFHAGEREQLSVVEFDYGGLTAYREKFPFLNDRDRFEVDL